MNRIFLIFKSLSLTAFICLLSDGNAQTYVMLKKWAIGAGGNIGNRVDQDLVISHTIGQSSLTSHFQSTRAHLLQGFQNFQLEGESFLQESDDFTISPNPATDRIVLHWSNAGIREQVQLILYDLNGRILFSRSSHRSGKISLPIEVEDLPEGIYLLEVSGLETRTDANHLIIRK